MAMNLADQLGWCITTKDYLNNLNSEMKYIANKYHNDVDTLSEWGYVQEWMPELKQLADEFEQEVNSIISYIENDHLAYIDKQSREIEGLV